MKKSQTLIVVDSVESHQTPFLLRRDHRAQEVRITGDGELYGRRCQEGETATGEEVAENNEGEREAKTGKRRRWDFDRPLAPASRAAGRANESSKEKVCPRPASTLSVALPYVAYRTYARPTSPGDHRIPARPVFYLDAAPIPNPFRDGFIRKPNIEFRPLNTSKSIARVLFVCTFFIVLFYCIIYLFISYILYYILYIFYYYYILYFTCIILNFWLKHLRNQNCFFM